MYKLFIPNIEVVEFLTPLSIESEYLALPTCESSEETFLSPRAWSKWWPIDVQNVHAL